MVPCMKRAVSVEGLPTPLRSAVLKSLHSRWHLCASDTERTAHPLALLLYRLQALAKSEPGQTVLWTGSWLLGVPSDAVMADLYGDLGRELCAALGLAGAAHLMLRLDTDVNEAFEHATGSDTLQALRDAASALDGTHRSPMEVQIASLPATAYAVDNPVALARVLTTAHAALQEWISPA